MVNLIEVMPVLCLALAIVFLPLLSEEPPQKHNGNPPPDSGRNGAD